MRASMLYHARRIAQLPERDRRRWAHMLLFDLLERVHVIDAERRA